jgi:hypothetical protein
VKLIVELRQDNRTFEESWQRTIEREWVPFGDPRPLLALGPDGVRAINPNGDGNFESGVYTRRAFEAARGLGLEVQLSTPLNEGQYQRIALYLDAGLDSTVLAGWDHRTGYPPQSTAGGGSWCNATYPATDMEHVHARIGAGAGIDAPSWMRSGRWYTFRFQLFPDGTCGLAVNGHALWRGRTSVAGLLRIPPLRVRIDGNSVGARMLVGPLEVWQGVRGGVDWGVLDRRR